MAIHSYGVARADMDGDTDSDSLFPVAASNILSSRRKEDLYKHLNGVQRDVRNARCLSVCVCVSFVQTWCWYEWHGKLQKQ